MRIQVLTWNLFHGRDFPPDPELFTWRSRLLRATEQGSTHVQVNRDLLQEFIAVLGDVPWDAALLQECPPRWAAVLADALGAESHLSLTSRNWLAPVRRALAARNPDLLGSWEGGANLTLVRGSLAAGGIVERDERTLRRLPERRTMALTRTAGVCIANLHASTAEGLAVGDVRHAANEAASWAGMSPLILGGDFNLRPAASDLFEHLERTAGLIRPTSPDAIDHLLVRGLEVVREPRAWPAEAREVEEDGRRLRLSDHAPVEAVFQLP